jgi:AcrR family transcriptional regulator
MADTWRERRHRATREEILAVARGLMLEEGVEGLSIREVARRTGFSPASLYTYFSSKDEIVAALTEESFRELNEYLSRVSGDLPPEERLVQLGLAYMEFAEDNPADLACVVNSSMVAELPEGIDPSLGLAAAHKLSDTLRDGIAAGVFPSGDDEVVAEMAYGLWSLVHGMTLLRSAYFGWVAPGVTVDAERVLRLSVETLKTGGGR